MFFFNRQSNLKKLRAFYPKNDLHAHILPGIDDGPKTLEEAINLVKGFVDLGYQQITATPHVFSDYYPNTSEQILAAFKILKEAIEKEGINIALFCAAEYYLDEAFKKLLETDSLLTIHDNYLLVETSTLANDPNLYDHIFQIQTRGFQAILAHPERYTYLEKDDFRRLKERGCLFQVNLLSLTGHYGKKVFKIVEFLNNKGYIDFISTDAHHLDHIKALQDAQKSKKVLRMLQSMQLKNDQLFS